MRSASVPRRVLFFAILIAAGSLADPAFAQDISINLGQGNGGVTERAIQLIALLTVLSIAPSILIMMTSFTRIVVVLSLLRTALGTATAPPNSVIIALAMFLTAFVMGPVLQKSYDDGIKPLVANQISVEEALQRASVPLRGFMQKNVREKDLKLFMDLSGEPPPATPEDMSLRILVPAFMISELKRAFEIGFLLFLPFLIIDLVVASVLMSMGMMMLPPVVVSLPFKLIFFVLVDGWSLVAGSLVQSYGGGLGMDCAAWSQIPASVARSALHIILLAEVIADLNQHRDAFGIAGLGDGRLVGRWRGIPRSLPSRRTEITMPSGQSAWTFSSALAIAISSASVLVGLLMMAASSAWLNRRRLPLRQAVCRGDDRRLSCARRAILPRPTRFNPTIAGNEPVGTGSAFGISGGSVALAVASGNRVFISRRKPSSVSTLAAILAIWANSALVAAAGLLAVSNAARSASPLISGAYFSRKRASPMASSASAYPTTARITSPFSTGFSGLKSRQRSA